MQYFSFQAAALIIIAFLVLYWTAKQYGHKFQNIVLLITSYLFYSIIDWKFLFLVIFISILNFYIAQKIKKKSDPKLKKGLLALSIGIHVAILFVFRFYNFFAEDINQLFSLVGINLSLQLFAIAVPLGISIYLLHSLSYLFDVYRNKLSDTSDIISFATYVSFFPFMMAGPIEKSVDFIPQLLRTRLYEKERIYQGLRRILWGVFKIWVIANNCAIYADEIFAHYVDYTGISVFIGLACFSVEFYAGFSGLSDIAIGIAEVFCFKCTTNFRFPFFSRSLSEFWSRWNISLINWLNEYAYSPFIQQTKSVFRKLALLILFFLLLGLWHGGKGSFILFALVNTILLIPIAIKTDRFQISARGATDIQYNLFDFPKFLIGFIVFTFALTFYRAGSFNEALNIFERFSLNLTSFSMQELRSLGNGFSKAVSDVLVLGFYVLLEWIYRNKDFALELPQDSQKKFNNFMLLIIIVVLILFFSNNYVVQPYLFF